MADADIRALAITFEAKKIALRQSKDGIALTLAIHPSDMKEALWQHHIGARYQVVVVEIGDDEQPKELRPAAEPTGSPSAPGTSGQAGAPVQASPRAIKPVKQAWGEMKLVTRAGIICNDPAFWEWTQQRPWNIGRTVENSDDAAAWLRFRTNVSSRKEYNTDKAAAQRYLQVESAFLAHKNDAARYGT